MLPPDLDYTINEQLREVLLHPEEVRQWVERWQQKAQQTTDVRERARWWSQIGVYERMLGDLEAAADHLEEAVRILEQQPLSEAFVVALIRLAHVYQYQQRFDWSNDLFADIVELVEREPKLTSLRDFAYQHLGKNLFDQQRYAEAQQWFQRALEIRLQKEDDELITATKWALMQTQRWLFL